MEAQKRVLSLLNPPGGLHNTTAGMQNGDGKTTLYTGAPGEDYIVDHLIVRNPTGSLAGGTDFDFGDGANADTWKTTVDLSGLTAVTDSIKIDNTDKTTVFNAGDEFGVKPATGATADVDATIEVWGHRIDL